MEFLLDFYKIDELLLRHMVAREKECITADSPSVNVPRFFVDSRHGILFQDSFRHLEDFTKEVSQWVNAENKRTFEYLNTISGREKIERTFTRLNRIPFIEDVSRVEPYTYLVRRKPGKLHPVLSVLNKETKERVLIDPNKLSKDGNTFLDWWEISDDSQYIAYGLSRGGTEMSTLYIKSVKDRTDLPEEIPNTRECSLSWLPDSRGFYYSRFTEENKSGQVFYRYSIYRHLLGRNWEEDEVIFTPSDLNEIPHVTVFHSDDDSFWYVAILSTDSKNNVAIYLGESGTELPIVPEFETILEPGEGFGDISISGNTIFLHTDVDAPMRRLVMIDLENSEKSDKSTWETLLPEEERLLESFGFAGNLLIASYLRDASPEVDIIRKNAVDDSITKKSLNIPKVGQVSGVSGAATVPAFFYSFEAHDFPSSHILAKVDDNLDIQEEVTFWSRMPKEYLKQLLNFTAEQVFYHSKDGTKIPMFIMMQKDTPRDGYRKAIINVYGGFGKTFLPAFNNSTFTWLADGNIVAIPVIRGGGEYGRSWHEAGASRNKKNSFSDCIAAAEYLVEEGYTAKSRLGIWGESNGALVAAHVVVERPDLIGAAVLYSGPYDIARYDQYAGTSQYVVGEYGDMNNPEDFTSMLVVSPYARVKPTAYPAILLVAGENDTRVHPIHTIKFHGALSNLTTSGRPVYMNIVSNTGHTGPFDYVDMLAFFNDQLK